MKDHVQIQNEDPVEKDELNERVSTTEHRRRHLGGYQLEFSMWGKERMFWWGLRWTTISHLGVRYKRRRVESNGVEGRGAAESRLQAQADTVYSSHQTPTQHRSAASSTWDFAQSCPVAIVGKPVSHSKLQCRLDLLPPSFRCLLPSCFPNYYTKQNKQALSRLEVGQTHIAPLAQLLKRLLAIAVFANKVWLSEPEHQRAGWIRQQQTQPADLGGLGAS